MTRTPSPVESRTPYRLDDWSFRIGDDEITEIAWGGTVLLSSLRPALRDRDWTSITPRVLDVSISASAPETGRSLTGGITAAYEYEGERAHAISELTVSPSALKLRTTFTAVTDVLTNRAGLTAMLPREFAGRDARMLTPDGLERSFRFPATISPWQPLFDIRALEFEHAGVRAHLELTGDVFEMEDQRNWTDASYKIYSRPLALPFPYEIAAGESVVQEAHLSILAAATPSPRQSVLARSHAGVESAGDPLDLETLLLTASPTSLPSLGTGATTAYALGAKTVPEPLTYLDHLVVETSDRFDQQRVLESAAVEAHALGVPVDLRITCSQPADIATVLAAAETAQLPLSRIGVFDAARHVTTPALWRGLHEAAADLGVELVAGARSHFTEFNREILAVPEDAAAYTFPSTPQMHLQEPWHVAESVAALGDVLTSAATLRPDTRFLLGPVSLRPRVNAVATRPDLVDRSSPEGYGAHMVPGSVDPRQHSEWAGAWAGAVIATAAAAGASTVSIAELAGPRGLLDEDGSLSPIGEVVAHLASGRGRPVSVRCGIAGSGTALICWDNRVAVFNARLDGWSLRLSAGQHGTSDLLEIPAGSYRFLTLPYAA